ncbi:MAG: type II secretion system GspH family protein [Sulfuricella denitrificans]|nr:type II secretion system GspH family protein [Sulfuricella denitrificans]
MTPLPATLSRWQPFLTRRPCFGFTLVEVTLALAVLGIIAAAAAAAYLGLFSASRNKLNADASLATIAGAVVAFAKSHHRLPCPDTDGSGNEGVCSVGPAGPDVGWFPYLSAGLTAPAPLARAIYGVYRAAGADLARAEEQSGDPVGSASYADGADLMRALRFAASQVPSNTQIYLTGDNARGGAENCGGNVVSNPAFVVLAPGEDRDGNGNPADGIHSTLPASGHCFAAPTRAVDTYFDDRTLAVSFYTLMAKLNNEL